MLTNHLKVVWRNIIRDRRTSLINLVGLSLGIASALILFVIVQYEWSYDRFHKNYDHIYRIVTETKYENSFFSKEFMYMVALAFCVAAPVAYYFMHDWLANFTYRIDLGVGLFLTVVLSARLIATLTIGIKAFRTAVANPVESLRDE